MRQIKGKLIVLLNKMIAYWAAILFILMSVGGIAVADTWDGVSENTDWYDASLSEFHLSTAAQLAGLSKIVNEENDFFQGKMVYLEKDIDLNNHPFRCIGDYSSAYFLGIFDGNEHTVKNINPYSANNFSTGLFGFVYNGARIRNLTVTGNFSSNTQYTGGITGYLYNAIIENCHNEAIVDASGYSRQLSFAGGIAGFAYGGGGVDRCTNCGTIKGNTAQSEVGGIIGRLWGPVIIDCCNSGMVTGRDTGGICGFSMKGKINHCINTGKITGTNMMSYYGTDNIGGIVGTNGYYSNVSCVVINCANYGMICSNAYTAFVGGIAGVSGYTDSPSEIRNCYNSGDISASDGYAGGIAGAYGGSAPCVLDNCYTRGGIEGSKSLGIVGELFHQGCTNSYWLNNDGNYRFDNVYYDGTLEHVGWFETNSTMHYLTYNEREIVDEVQSTDTLLGELQKRKIEVGDDYLPWVIAQNHNDFYPVFGMPVKFTIKPNGNEGYEEIQTSIESYNHDDYELGDHVYYFADTDTVSFAAKENTGFRFIEAKYVDGEKFISEQTASENNFSFKMGAFPVEIELWYDSQQIVNIVKIWNDADYESNQRPPTLDTQLVIGSVAQADVNGNTVFQLTEDPDTHAWSKTVYLPAKDYSTLRATEEEIPGYEQEDYSRSTASDGTLIFTFTNKRTVVPVENYVVTKVWKGTNPAGNRQLPRPEITVILYADGVEYDRKVIQAGAEDPVTVRFEDVPKYKDGNTLIQYTIREEITDSDWVKVGENEWYSLDGMGKYTGYIESASANAGNTENQTDEIRETATNTYAALQSTTSAEVIKHWEDHQNENSIRPVCVKLGLFLPGAADPLAAVTLKGAENADAWNGTFNELPLYDESGRIIDYSTCIVMEAYPETYHDDGTPATWGAWIDDGEQVLVEKDGMTYTYDYSAATP